VPSSARLKVFENPTEVKMPTSHDSPHCSLASDNNRNRQQNNNFWQEDEERAPGFGLTETEQQPAQRDNRKVSSKKRRIF